MQQERAYFCQNDARLESRATIETETKKLMMGGIRTTHAFQYLGSNNLYLLTRMLICMKKFCQFVTIYQSDYSFTDKLLFKSKS